MLGMRFETSPGPASTVIGIAGSGVALIWPEQKWIGFVLIALAAAVFFFDVRLNDGDMTGRWPRRTKMVPLALMLCGALAFVVGLTWFLKMKPESGKDASLPAHGTPKSSSKPAEVEAKKTTLDIR